MQFWEWFKGNEDLKKSKARVEREILKIKKDIRALETKLSVLNGSLKKINKKGSARIKGSE